MKTPDALSVMPGLPLGYAWTEPAYWELDTRDLVFIETNTSKVPKQTDIVVCKSQ